ncbi:MAG: acyl-CoA synthetase [Anaerolineae bacterium]|nr:acyl-CoA synthetase [Anaerolineae bacterium]
MLEIRTIADIVAFESTPLAERNLPDSTYEVFARGAQKRPDKTALTFFLQGTKYEKSVSYSYRDWFGRMTQAANMFHDLGVGPNDVVSYILPNLPETFITLYGAEAVGISNPLNPLLEPDTLAEIMKAAETKVLVTVGPFPNIDLWQKSAEIVAKVPSIHTILQVDLADHLSGLTKLVVKLMQRREANPPVKARVLNFNKTLKGYSAEKLTFNRAIKPDDVASYFHTGGTTGIPKLAIHTHRNEVFDSWMAATAAGADETEITLCGLPLFHNFGAIAAGLGLWSVGSTVVLASPQGYRGEGVVPNFWKIVEHYRCTSFNTVPTLIKSLLDLPVGDADISSLASAICGAAPLPVEWFKQFRERTGVGILEGYGLTEATSVNSVNPRYGEQRVGSIGFRLPYQEMRIAIIEDGKFERFAETDEVGVVILRGPNVFPGYKESVHNVNVFVDSGDGGAKWLNTGDMGRQDADGYFWLTGRKKELIIRGGHNIDPKLIEEPIHEHPAVAVAAAVGRPDARVGELPVVYVELKPGQTATEEEILEFAREHVGERAAVPKRIYIVNEIPLTAVGKIFKPALSRAQVVDVYQEEVAQVDGVEKVVVSAEADKVRGTIAYVNVTAQPGTDKVALEQDVRTALGQYSVAYELSIG